MCILSFPTLAVKQDIKNFSKDDMWQSVKISPMGDFISGVTKIEGKKVIVLFDAKTLKPIHSLKFKGYEQPGEHFWVSDQRLVTEKEYLKGWQDAPVNYGEFYAINANGYQAKYIFGYQTASVSFSKNMWGELLDPMPENDKYMLLTAKQMSRTGEHLPKVYRINIKTGSKKELAQSPVMFAKFLTDQHHNVRFVTGVDEDNQYKTFLYKDEKWLSTAELNIENESFNPISINGDKNQVYATYSQNGEPAGLYLFDLDTGNKVKIFQHDKVAITSFKKDKSGQIYALEYDDGYPMTKIITPNNPEAKVLTKLTKKLEGYSVSVASETLDGNTKVVFAYNQFNPGDYLLYNVKKDELTFMFSKRPWVDVNKSANVVPFNFKARDDLEISAYVTLPLGSDYLKDAKNLPFVVNVHGGPHGVRDYLQYNQENQLYASKGIGVLQINYRGSSGYGYNFEKLGYMHWGDKVQYDIIDGINALIQKGIADKSKLCIVGGSFGGYSALQSAILEPDLFKCAIGVVGVYDLELMHEIGDIQTRSSGQAYLNKVIGENKVDLKTFSPINNLDKLKASVFIIHGGEDKRVPVEHAKELKKGLSKYNINHEWLIFDDEGHGFYKPEHREKVYQRSLSFLERELKLGL
jgi:dipeptidyl aminopeptidase/acylaminoacyl peptidase